MSNILDNISIEEIVHQAALAAIREYKKEEKESVKKTRYHNTGLLMDHYIDFIDHYETIKYRASDLDDEDLEDLQYDLSTQDDLIIQSIKRSKVRTKIMISQIETAVSILEKSMKQKNELEKSNVIKKLYMDRDKVCIKFNQRVKEVADELNCHEASVRRWNTEMLNELSVRLFGVDGLKLDI